VASSVTGVPDGADGCGKSARRCGDGWRRHVEERKEAWSAIRQRSQKEEKETDRPRVAPPGASPTWAPSTRIRWKKKYDAGPMKVTCGSTTDAANPGSLELLEDSINARALLRGLKFYFSMHVYNSQLIVKIIQITLIYSKKKSTIIICTSQ
jgi:hypothetical protein